MFWRKRKYDWKLTFRNICYEILYLKTHFLQQKKTCRCLKVSDQCAILWFWPLRPQHCKLPARIYYPIKAMLCLLIKTTSIYIYKRDCLFLCIYLCPSFTRKLPDQSQPKFVQTSTPPQGRFLTQVWPCQLNPLIPGYLKLQNLMRISGEKRLIYKKCSKLFPPQAWPGFGSYLYACHVLVMLESNNNNNLVQYKLRQCWYMTNTLIRVLP